MSTGVVAPADKRFRRAHVKPARRTRPRAARIAAVLRVVVAAALLGVLGWRAGVLLSASPALRIARIEVRGATRVPAADIRALLQGLEGRPVLFTPLSDWRERVAAHPWVEQVTLRRVLPGGVLVDIRERTPVGIARIGTALELVDRSGTRIDAFGPAYANLDLPIIDGLAVMAEGAAPAVDPRRARLAARLLADLAQQPQLLARVSQISVADARDAVVLLRDDGVQLRLGDREFADRIQDYLDLAGALRERVARIDTVDLRFGDRLFVRPVRDAEAGSR